MNKFDNVSVEEDTAILLSIESKLGDIDCLSKSGYGTGSKGKA